MINDNLIELLGTYLYVLINLYTNNSIIIGIFVSFIIILCARLLSYKGDFNPAVTLAMLFDGRITSIDLLIKYACQFLSAILAYFTYKILI